MKRELLATAALLALACPVAAQTPEPVSPIAAPPVPAPAQEPVQVGTQAAPAAADADEPAKWDVQNPPGPSRDIPIDVTRGTWMSVDVSPDGRTIAFDMLGDIYVMPVSGGAWTSHLGSSASSFPGSIASAGASTATGAGSGVWAHAGQASASKAAVARSSRFMILHPRTGGRPARPVRPSRPPRGLR